MCEDARRNQNGSRNDQRDRERIYEQNDRNYGYRDYGHVHERVEETDSTKNPPKER